MTQRGIEAAMRATAAMQQQGTVIDLAMMARAQGAEGIGPITSSAELRPATEKAIESVRNGAVVGLDIRVEPGYDTSMNGSGGRTA
jgi:hypothetical protein